MQRIVMHLSAIVCYITVCSVNEFNYVNINNHELSSSQQKLAKMSFSAENTDTVLTVGLQKLLLSTL